MDRQLEETVSSVRAYWDSHPLGRQYFQFLSRPDIEEGSREFFAEIRPWMNPYKFPWIMERIEREAGLIGDGHLLEIGCGMGYDSLEFLKRGVRVTATDLTPTAVALAEKHFGFAGVRAEAVQVENGLELSFPDDTFDAVWSNGVLHATGDTARAIREVHRVLKPGGRAIISHFYRKPSWMYLINRWGRENIEYKEEDPPVNEFYTEREVDSFFDGFEIVERAREHHRALPAARKGWKATLYHWGFKPVYNLLPEAVALRYAYKYSITAVKV